MQWQDVCRSHPNEWVVIEALEAHTAGARRVLDRVAVIEVCPDGAAAHRRYRDLHGAHPNREFYFAHTTNADLDVEERPWAGIRHQDAPHPPR